MLRLATAMTKRARSLTPTPDASKLAAAVSNATEPANISAHPAKRAHTDVKFLPRKIATAEDAAKADRNTPFAQLQEAIANQVKSAKGEAVVYWMRMQDMRSRTLSLYLVLFQNSLIVCTVRDNGALSRASALAQAESQSLIVLFVLSPQDYIAHDRSARRVDFVLRNLVHIKVRGITASVFAMSLHIHLGISGQI